MSEKTPQGETPKLRWEDVSASMPDDGCVLFEKYDPDLFKEDDQGCLPERRGPVRRTLPRESPRTPSQAPTTPKRIVNGVSKLVFLILFALSQCGTATPQPNRDDPQADNLPAKNN